MTGCPSIDIARAAQDGEPVNGDLFVRFGGVGRVFDFSQKFAVVLQHPVTTEYGQAFEQATATLHAVHETGVPTIWFWPNVDAGSDGTSKAIRTFRENHPDAPFHFFRSLPPEDFNRLLTQAAAIVGNSSAAIRECAYLGTPAVNIGSRQTGRERGPNVIDVGYDEGEISGALRRQLDHGRYPASTIYGDGTAGVRIAETIAGLGLSLK
jgi:UDP-N-acetylglucosamine 2-epimerase